MKKSMSLLIIMILMCAVTSGAADLKKVAVLPFAANSSENIEYIRDGVTDMLISRISVDGKIEVLSKYAVEETLGKVKKKGFTQSDAYVLGKKLKVDYVVWGSITKIGNSMSIDGKMVDIAVNKSPVSVFVQSQGTDEIIPKITDFAKRIDMHILGTVPPSFAPVASTSSVLPPATGQTLTQTAQPGSNILREPKASETLGTKQGTLTAAINPDFINAPTSLSRKGFWMSQRIEGAFVGMDVGDVDHDGKNEIVCIDRSNVFIFRKEKNALKQIDKIVGKKYDRYLSVDVADINGTDTKQIFVSSINNGILNSFVLEYRDGKYEKIASDLRWLLRVIYISGKPVLLGQTLSNEPEQPFMSPIFELAYTSSGKYRDVRRMKIPEGLSIYDIVIDPLEKSGPDRVVAIDNLDYIRVIEETDKPLENLIRFFTVKEMIWKSEEQYGGSANTFENMQRILSTNEVKPQLPYVNIRMLMYDLYKEGKKDLLVVNNHSSSTRVFRELKYFTSSTIHDLEWSNLGGFSEVWKTKKINGYITDMQIRDIDGDGKPELVLALNVGSNLALMPQSVVVSYSLDIKKPEQSDSLTETSN